MSNNTEISWAHATWNPVTGCDKVSTGCQNCYAETMTKRWTNLYPTGFEVTEWPNRLDQPTHWRKPKIIFVNSMSDLLHDEINYDFLQEIVNSMLAAPQHVYLILTKRQQHIADFNALVARKYNMAGLIPENIWLGVSAENQYWYDKRVPALIDNWHGYKFLSLEPLLGQIDITSQTQQIPTPENPAEPEPWLDINWIITGGESGPKARRVDPGTFYTLKNDCDFLDIPFHFKQWGTFNEDGERHSKTTNGNQFRHKTLDEDLLLVPTGETYKREDFPDDITNWLAKDWTVKDASTILKLL